MIRRRILTAVVVVMFAVSSLLSIVFTSNVSAQQTSRVGGNALRVSPVRQDVAADPGTSRTVEVYISNLTSVPATLHAAINDFTASNNESGQPNIILDENQFAPSHSLKQFVAKIPDFKIAPGEQKTIKVVINIPSDAPGGGYYGAIRFLPATSPLEEGKLNLSASVGSLLLLKVNGDVIEKMKVASFDVRRGDNSAIIFTSNKGLTNVIRLQNEGNIQLQPFGKVILSRFGKVVKQYEVNNTEPRGNVLPDSIRRFEVKLGGGISNFGKFKLEGNFGYGTTGQFITASKTFYVIPVALMVLGLVVLGIILFLIFGLPRMIRAYNKSVIRRASRRR